MVCVHSTVYCVLLLSFSFIFRRLISEVARSIVTKLCHGSQKLMFHVKSTYRYAATVKMPRTTDEQNGFDVEIRLNNLSPHVFF